MFSFFKKAKETARPTPVVVPRSKHRNFLAAVDGIPGMTDESRPIIEPLVGDLLLTHPLSKLRYRPSPPGWEVAAT